jgi:hypothetical protein
MRSVETPKRLSPQRKTCIGCGVPRLRGSCGALVPLVMLGLACGSSNSGDSSPASHSGSGSPSAPASPTSAGPGTESAAPPPAIPPEAVAAVTDAIGMAAANVQAACGAPLDACSATPGCNEILACAAFSGCTGGACYCADARCETAGPCRSAIAGAPGAQSPDAESGSYGPAADAAAAVGDCLAGLGGGRPRSPTPPQSSIDGGAPSADPDAG